MRVEITLEDLEQLIEMARSLGKSVVYPIRTTDDKRIVLLVTVEPRRRQRARPATQKADAVQQGG